MALVPRPRIHLTRYHGVLGPHYKHRKQIVPNPPELKLAIQEQEIIEPKQPELKKKNIPWARLLARVFNIDIETCSQCGGDTFTSILATKKLGGACSEEVMPSNETFLNANETNPRIFGAFKWLEQKSWALPETLEAARVIFPGFEEDTFYEASHLSTFKDRMHFLQSAACTERVPSSHLTLNYFEAETKSQVLGLIKKVNRQLERNNLMQRLPKSV